MDSPLDKIGMVLVGLGIAILGLGMAVKAFGPDAIGEEEDEELMRYRVDGVPAKGAGAFMPGLVLNGVSFGAGLRSVYGFPGTLEVPVDHDQNLSALGHDPKTQPSNVAPDVILPTVYIPGARYMGPWAARGAMHTPGIYGGGNPLPEPAGAPSGIPLPAAVPPARLGGSKVIGWPRVSPSWQSVTTGRA